MSELPLGNKKENGHKSIFFMSPISQSKGKKIIARKSGKTLKLKKVFNEAALKPASKETLTYSGKMYRDLVEMAHEGITMVDPYDTLTFVNKQFAKSLGYKVSELVGRSLFSLATKATATQMKNRQIQPKTRIEINWASLPFW